MRNLRQNPDPGFFYSGDPLTPIFQAEPARPCHHGKPDLGTAATKAGSHEKVAREDEGEQGSNARLFMAFQ